METTKDGGSVGSGGSGRSGYHHGDLRNALVRAATDLAAAGGPEAVVLRQAARQVGVSPTAAYRHFTGQGDLVEAIKEIGQEALAASMEEALAECPSEGDPAEVAMARAKAAGRGYLRFAFAEPGLFRTAFYHVPGSPEAESIGDKRDRYPAYLLLATALDDLVTTGLMPPARRPGAEISAWSAVHGLSQLVLDGPLNTLEGPDLTAAVESLLEAITSGLCT